VSSNRLEELGAGLSPHYPRPAEYGVAGSRRGFRVTRTNESWADGRRSAEDRSIFERGGCRQAGLTDRLDRPIVGAIALVSRSRRGRQPLSGIPSDRWEPTLHARGRLRCEERVSDRVLDLRSAVRSGRRSAVESSSSRRRRLAVRLRCGAGGIRQAILAVPGDVGPSGRDTSREREAPQRALHPADPGAERERSPASGIPKGKYFLWVTRASSANSRVWGPSASELIGKARCSPTYWSPPGSRFAEAAGRCYDSDPARPLSA